MKKVADERQQYLNDYMVSNDEVPVARKYTFPLTRADNNAKNYNQPWKERFPNHRLYENIRPSELCQLDDKKMDRINLNKSAELDRTGVFIYFDGVIYIIVTGKEQNFAYTHPDLIHYLIKDQNINNPRLEQELRKFRFLVNDNDKIITDKNELNALKMNMQHQVSMGHICNGNVAIIDSTSTSNKVNAEIVKAALLQAGCSKVYLGDCIGLSLTKIKRVARRLYKRI